MELKQFIVICLILIAIEAVAVFVINVAWNLAELITNAVVIILTMIGSVVLFVGSIVVGMFSWIVLGIVRLIVCFKRELRKDKK